MGAAMKSLRGVMVGSGHFASIQIEAWQDVRGARIVGIASAGDKKRLGELAKRFAVPEWSSSMDDLLDLG